MVRYGDSGYRVYIPQKRTVFVCRDEKFDDEKLHRPVQMRPEMNEDAVILSDDDDGDARNPEPDESAADDVSEDDDVTSPMGAAGGTPVRARVVSPTAPVPTTPR